MKNQFWETIPYTCCRSYSSNIKTNSINPTTHTLVIKKSCQVIHTHRLLWYEIKQYTRVLRVAIGNPSSGAKKAIVVATLWRSTMAHRLASCPRWSAITRPLAISTVHWQRIDMNIRYLDVAATICAFCPEVFFIDISLYSITGNNIRYVSTDYDRSAVLRVDTITV